MKNFSNFVLNFDPVLSFDRGSGEEPSEASEFITNSDKSMETWTFFRKFSKIRRILPSTVK